MDSKRLLRQRDILPLDRLGEEITVIGCGAIGSLTVLALAKMGFARIRVFDPDQVEPQNMNCQFFRHTDIGRNKALALQSLIRDFTEVELEALGFPYESGQFGGIVISAVDSMKARMLIWENHVGSKDTRAVIDPRMGAETALLYCMNPNDKKDYASYAKTLYTDDEAVQEPCTAKSTMYTASMLSGLVAKTVKNIVMKEPTLRVVQWGIKDNQFLGWVRNADEA